MLILCGLVENVQVLQTCVSTISTIEVNGPCLVSDSAVSYLVAAFTILQEQRLHSSKDISERLLTWIFRTWAPSRLPRGH